jgi:uncharacterized protein YcgL (UPF0745 family)
MKFYKKKIKIKKFGHKNYVFYFLIQQHLSLTEKKVKYLLQDLKKNQGFFY